MDFFFIILLVVGSIVGVTIIVERGLALRWRRVIPAEVESALHACRKSSDLPIVRQMCEQKPSPLSRLVALACEHREWPRDENANSLQIRARHEIVQLERGLVILEIVVGIAPLLGLVGTIYGLILLFGSLGQNGLNDSGRLASGIALALNATLLGLLTAIPSLIAWSYYNKKVETLAVEMETLCEEFLKTLYQRQEAPEIVSR